MRPVLRLTLLPAVVAALLALAAPALAGGSLQTDIPYDGTPDLKNVPAPTQHYPLTSPATPLLAGAPLHNGVAPTLTLTLFDFDPAHPGPYDVPFWREYTGAHSDIYVAWNDLASSPDAVQQDHAITSAQVAYIGQEFDARIWESDVFHFGNYKARAPRPGMDGTRAAIFVYNIRDEAYWGPYRFYVAGFFSSSLNDDLNVNAIFVDSYNWKDRVGVYTARPSLSHLYEGTVAHEFQHLIHNDVDPDEADFINEGMADMAEQFVYGTAGSAGHIGEYLFYHRDSLTDWKGELFDYGDSVLWQDYLWERAGGTDLDAPLASRVAAGYENDRFAETAAKFTDPGDRFIWNEIHDQATGLRGVADQVGGMKAVEALHHDWTLANLLDGKVADAKYNYQNLVLGGTDSDGLTIDDGIAYYESNANGNIPPTRKNVRRRTATEAWGAYYRTYGGSEPGFTMSFTGNAADGISPHTGATEWYSGGGNNLQRTVERVIPGVAAGASLSFWTWFDIEQDWDYGFVEASADGVTWTRLAQTSALPTGVSDLNGSGAWEGPGGLTGTSAGWQQATYSLASFSGDVHVRFRYATDEGYNGQGWYIDDVTAGGFSDPVDSSAAWSTAAAPDGWLFTSGLQTNDWTADAVVPFAKAQKRGITIVPVLGVDATAQSATAYVDAQYQKSFKVYGVVSNRPDGAFASTGILSLLKGQ